VVQHTSEQVDGQQENYVCWDLLRQIDLKIFDSGQGYGRHSTLKVDEGGCWSLEVNSRINLNMLLGSREHVQFP